MLTNYLKIDYKRAFFNWKFPVSSLIVCLLLFYNKNEPGNVVSWMCNINQMAFILIAMAVASVPYVASYVDETCHSYKMQMILRGNSSHYYIVSKMCIVFLSTVCTFFCGFSIALIIKYIRSGMPEQDYIDEILEINVAYSEFIKSGNFILYFIVCIFHLSIFSGFMALLGLLITQFVNNRIAAYSFPVLFVYIQDILVQRLIGWQRGSAVSLKSMGINQFEMVLPGQSVEGYFIQILCYIVIVGYFINYMNKGEFK